MRISRTNPSRRLPSSSCRQSQSIGKETCASPTWSIGRTWQSWDSYDGFRRGGFGFDRIVQGFQQRLPDGLQFSFVLDLHAEDIFHVEDVDNLSPNVEIFADVICGLRSDGLASSRTKARTITAVHFDDGAWVDALL